MITSLISLILAARLELPPELEAELAAQDAATLTQDALARRAAGDLEGAIQRFEVLSRRDPSLVFELALSYELAEDFETALTLYSQSELPNSVFRAGLCLEELGRWSEALERYERLDPDRTWTADQKANLELAKSAAALMSGEGGPRAVRRALRRSAESPLPWMRSRALYTLEVHELSAQADIPLDGRRAAKALEERAAHIAAAEAQVVQIVEIGQADWIIKALVAYGDAYLDLRADMLAAPLPKELTPAQLAMYQDMLRQRTDVLLRKAWEAYDQALVVGGRFNLDNRLTRQATERRDQAQALIDAAI